MTGGDRQELREDLAREEARLAELDVERDRVRKRVVELRGEIVATGDRDSPEGRATPPSTAQNVEVPSGTAEKIALFRSLFRGRTDVFPTRWVSAGKSTSGYSPACANEWIRDVCDKRRVRCGECPNRAFLPVTDKVIVDHLLGRHAAGVYPLLEDDSCWFLAVDFDKGRWKDDVSAFLETCKRLDVPAAVERSRSGDGAHVWFFFGAPVPASTARKLGCHILTGTMARRHELPMTSYDRLFPNQDTMPRGGFGNLIALPFQDGPRRRCCPTTSACSSPLPVAGRRSSAHISWHDGGGAAWSSSTAPNSWSNGSASCRSSWT